MLARSRTSPDSIYQKAALAITTGDLLTKVNFNNGAKSQRYFRVFRDNSLRWAKKEKDLTNPKVYKSCSLASVKGIVYGKASKRMMKSAKQLDSWLCFSIIT
mmetsp:Transcript_28761/g.25888  ORF Transcript_28761/g.25888 Transcript_28761/m.25888 type:complete len:102 (-) Transcript_28761:500-805(-)